MLSDGELLRRYVDDGSEAAFTELVQRHINVVYGSALRRVGRNAHAADDVTQRVFTDLARKAKSLKGRPSLGGWLYTGARFAAAEMVRAERRRRTHEQEAHLMNELTLRSSRGADRIEPFLDEVIDLLDEREREAVLLHFFEGHSFAEVGAILSLSADAARMRVNRALERLRTGFERRGIASTGAALAAVLSSQSTIAAPAPLALAVASRALSEADALALGGGTPAARGLLQAMKSSPIALSTGGVVLIALAGLAFYSLRPREPAATGFAVAGNTPAAGAKSSANKDETSPVPLIPDMTTQRPAAASLLRSGEFGSLTTQEKNLLAMLWSQRERTPSLPGLRAGLRVGAEAPNRSGVDRLVAKGWADIGQPRGMVYLTPDGAVFCEAHRTEIEAYVPYANRPSHGG